MILQQYNIRQKFSAIITFTIDNGHFRCSFSLRTEAFTYYILANLRHRMIV